MITKVFYDELLNDTATESGKLFITTSIYNCSFILR